MKTSISRKTIIIVLAACAFCSGCTPVKTWQRGDLARPHMSFDPDPLESESKQHMYFSKEASSGGYGVGGGGCGCN